MTPRRSRQAPLGMHRVKPPARFAANERLRRVAEPEGCAVDLVDAMVRRHCAGMRDRPHGGQVLAALRKPPEKDCPVRHAIRWMLGSARIADLHCLAWRCGVRLPLLADHARALGLTRRPIVRWLNQFAAP